MAAAMGYAMHFGVDDTTTTPDEEYEFNGLSLRMNEDLLEAAGIRGIRGKASERVVQNTRAPGFSLSMQLNSVELDVWLPRILGGSESSDSFPLAETLPTFVATFDIVTTRLSFTGCKVDRCTFSAQQGGPLNVAIDVEALDFSVSGSSFPSLSISTVQPYTFAAHTASGLSVGGSAYQFKSWQMVVDNVLIKDRFLNAQARVSLPESDRIITWSWDGPHGDNWANLFGLSASGVASVAAFTLANRSLTFTSSKVAYPRELPTTQDRAELMLPLTGIARRSGSTAELTTVNDSSA
jgi:hypothetical protein